MQDGSGACLLLACLWEETLVIANVGDSRAVIGSYKGGATQGTLLTNDHNAINPIEAKLARFRFLRNQGTRIPLTPMTLLCLCEHRRRFA